MRIAGVVEIIENCNVSVINNTHFSRAFAISKRDSEKYRLVVDFRKVNSRIKDMEIDFQEYTDSVESLLQSIPSTSKFHASVDISDAFHQIPVRPVCYKYVGVTDGVRHYYYKFLPQGLLVNPYWWCYSIKLLLAHLVTADINQLHLKGYSVYMDDIAIYGTTRDECQSRLDVLIKALEYLNIPINMKKVIPPSAKLDICGLEVEDGKWQMSQKHIA